MVQDPVSLSSPAVRFCTGRPPSMICSALNSIFAGIGNCGMPAISARKAGTTRSGSELLSLVSLAANLSASSCRAESTACSSGEAPKLTSPRPENLSARSSAP